MRVEIQHYGPGWVIARQGNNVHVLLDKRPGAPTSKIRPKAIWAYAGEWEEIDKPTDPFEPAPNEIQAGMIVEHPRFGIGLVVEILPPNDAPPSERALIDFEEAGRKTLLVAFAKLKIIR